MEITIIYTNWRRKDNLSEIISNCKKQTLLPKIVVVDNAFSDEDNKFIDSDIEILERDNSLKCWARWIASFNYDSKYICIMDDDISFSRDNVLEDCYNYMENNSYLNGIGCEGVELNRNSEYFNSNHVFSSTKDILVPIIKGRFMFIRKTSLNNLDLTPDLTCDDIKVSYHLKNKVVPSFLSNSFYNLKQGTESLSGKQYQYNKRLLAAKKYFK